MIKFQEDGCKIDISKPFMRATVFKKSGKWYTTEYTLLSQPDLAIINDNHGFVILDEIRSGKNQTYTTCISGMTVVYEAFNVDGFFHHIVEFP